MRTLASASVVSFIATGLLAGAALGAKPDERSPDAKERTVFVTGSLIPKRLKLKRIGTTTVSPVRIIDRNEIDWTGRQTTQGALIADPSVRAVGR
ncbi:MAG: hypothetical protein DLM73_07435 [Chthoniobacterales bacterium]|nr:MAG: hypothetical protein DLM73_07435 [Chthoniobacterales bacterium]